MYKQDLSLNNQQGLTWHQTQPTNQPTNRSIDISKFDVFPEFFLVSISTAALKYFILTFLIIKDDEKCQTEILTFKFLKQYSYCLFSDNIITKRGIDILYFQFYYELVWTLQNHSSLRKSQLKRFSIPKIFL